MKRFALLSLVAALFCTLQAGAQTLYNASFEQEGESADLASSWSRWGDWVNRETGWTPVHDGSCLIGYHHWEISGEGTSGLYQDLSNADPAKQYTFKIYAMRDDPTEPDQCGPSYAEVRLESTVDGKQIVVASQRCEIGDISTTLSGSWTALTVTGKPINNTLRVLVIAEACREGKRGGSLKFDDASLFIE